MSGAIEQNRCAPPCAGSDDPHAAAHWPLPGGLAGRHGVVDAGHAALDQALSLDGQRRAP